MNFRNARLVAVLFVLATFAAAPTTPVRADFGTNSPGGGKQAYEEPVGPEAPDAQADDSGTIGGLFAALFDLFGIDI